MENLEEILLDVEYQSRMGNDTNPPVMDATPVALPEEESVAAERGSRLKGKRVGGARLKSNIATKKKVETTKPESVAFNEAEELARKQAIADKVAKEAAAKEAEELAKKQAIADKAAKEAAAKEAKELAKQQAKKKAAKKAKE
ncbi:MAG: hypothetical protein R3Y62_06915, partial [Eubacteriales bacterium]